jgi:hypothetical protein
MLCSRGLAFSLCVCIALHCLVLALIFGCRIGVDEEEYKVLLHHNVKIFHYLHIVLLTTYSCSSNSYISYCLIHLTMLYPSFQLSSDAYYQDYPTIC